MALPEETAPVETGAKKKRGKGRPKKAAKRASVPPGTDLSKVTLADALKYLSLPRELGIHPSTGKPVIASTGRFGPYIGHDVEFRALKPAVGEPYTVTLDQALALLAEPKKPPRGVTIVREIGAHPRTGKQLILYKS